MTYALRPVRTPHDWRHLHDIRRALLFVEGRRKISYDENHPDDRASNHFPFLLVLDDRPIGTARLDVRGKIGIVRLVAIVASEQRRGHGRALDRLVEDEARRRGVTVLRVNAAHSAVGFYEKTGWRHQEWDASELTGIATNSVQMVKAL